MRPGRSVAAALAGAAVLCALGAGVGLGTSSPASTPAADTGGDDPTHLVFSGISPAGDEHAIVYHSVGGGAYLLGYRMDVQFSAARESTLLRCGLLDPNGVIDYVRTQSFQTVDQGPSHVAYVGRFRLPELTLKLACVTTQTDTVTVDITGLRLTVQAYGELRS